jgi:RES domain-containing protein
MALDRTRIATAPRVAHAATAFRNQSPRYDPRSGEGARINGGRFNPPGSFPTLYLCETRPCVVAELTRQGTRHVVGVEGLLPRVLYRYELDLHRILDLTDPDTRTQIGITVDELAADDWTVCQQLGTEAHTLGDQGIRTYSATGVDTVLVVFPELLGGSLTTVELVERWDDLADLA